jgi:hypothetical protein
MFFLAAMIEGFISPFEISSIEWLNYGVKVAVSVLSTILLMFYFVVLGFPKDGGFSETEAERAAG